MYEFPYGGEQQLNLNWIINEIITLHKRLDPDYELPNFDNAFPYMNLNQLNLDWILRELKAIKDLAPTEDAQLLKMVANALIANTYDAETQYNVDDIVYRDGDNRLYKCITATPAGGEPFDSSKWVEVDVGGVLTDLLNSVITPPAPYDSNPAMDGTASAGTSTQYARGDHVHPKDTARVPTSRTINGKALSSNITLNASDIPNDSNVPGDNTDDALNNLDSTISNVQSTIAIVAEGDTHIAISSGDYVYIKNHGTLSTGLYRATANIPLNDPLTVSNVSPVDYGGLNQITSIAHGGTNADNYEEALRNLGLSTGVLIGASIFGTGVYTSHQTGDQMYFMFGKFGSNPLAFIQLTNSGSATIIPLVSNTATAHIPTVSVVDGKTKIEMPAWETLRYFSYYPNAYFEQL